MTLVVACLIGLVLYLAAVLLRLRQLRRRRALAAAGEAWAKADTWSGHDALVASLPESIRADFLPAAQPRCGHPAVAGYPCRMCPTPAGVLQLPSYGLTAQQLAGRFTEAMAGVILLSDDVVPAASMWGPAGQPKGATVLRVRRQDVAQVRAWTPADFED